MVSFVSLYVLSDHVATTPSLGLLFVTNMVSAFRVMDTENLPHISISCIAYYAYEPAMIRYR